MKSWLNTPSLLKRILSESRGKVLEFFLLSLLKSRSRTTVLDGNGKHDVRQFLERLRSVCDDCSEFRKLSDIAISVMESQQELSWGDLSPHRVIFYWECVFCEVFGVGTNTTGSNIQLELADCAMDSMMPLCKSNDRPLARQAMVCISDFVPFGSHDSHVRLIQCAVDTILKSDHNFGENEDVDNNGAGENLLQTLECLALCINETGATEYFLKLKDWEKIFSNLVCVMVNEQDVNVAEKAVTIIVPLLETLITRDEHYSSILFNESIKVLSVMLSSKNIWITGRGIDLLYALLQDSKIRCRFESSTLLPDLINSLALVGSKEILVEEIKKAKLADVFSQLLEKIKNLHFVVRKTSNLAFLVRLANGSYCETTDQSRIRQLSIIMVLKLARNPCNRRILAKEPGLLSTLIRYTRIARESNEVFLEENVTRKEMKDRILLIANAL
mmetsp:Transcript_13270/g.28111  ORF Transcript_13270/g.28111 Transcript_13270/m.28111 type:complete len:444 (-) Transcript_13270:92-1423(-)